MTREEAKKRVLDYVYGEMPEDSRREFESVLAEDHELRAEVESVAEVRRATADLEPVRLPPDVHKALMRAARRKIAVHEGQEPDIRTMIERFFLSPAFSGALVVLVSLGVGIHLILETGLEDRITRLEKAERTAARAVGQPAAPRAEMVEPPATTVSLASEEPRANDGPMEAVVRVDMDKVETKAPAKAGKVRRKRSQARKTPRVPRQAGPVAGADSDRQDKESVEAEAPVSASTGTGEDLRLRGVGKGGGGARGYGRSVAGSAPAPKVQVTSGLLHKSAAPARDRQPAAAMEEADGNERAALEGRVALVEARKKRARGELKSALSAYQKAIAAGLEGQALRDALYEAADTARKLGRKDTARKLLLRLSRLPGGTARGAEMMMELDAEAEE